MALQSSGAISLSQIAAEFGGSVPHSMSEYRGSGGTPSTGAIDFSDFYGTSSGPATSGLLFDLDARDSYSWSGSGSNWADLSNELNDFTLVNGPSNATNAIAFDGSNDYAQIADGTWIPEGTSAKSFEMMIKMHSYRTGYYDFFVSKTSPSNQSFSFGLDHTTSNTVKLSLGTQGGGSFGAGGTEATATLSGSYLNSYHHFAFTYDGSVVKMYVDASLVYTSGSGKSLHSNTAVLRLMAFDPSNSFYSWPVDGEVRFTRMYDRALSASEVNSNMNA